MHCKTIAKICCTPLVLVVLATSLLLAAAAVCEAAIVTSVDTALLNTGAGYKAVYKVECDGSAGVAWAAARSQCAAHGPGWDLATIPSATVDAAIAALSTDNIMAAGTDDGHEGTWTWEAGRLKGRTFYTTATGCAAGSYCHFNVGNPDNWGAGEHFLSIWEASLFPGREWNDIPNAIAKCYACERSPCEVAVDCNASNTKSVTGAYYVPGEHCGCVCKDGFSGPRCDMIAPVINVNDQYLSQFMVQCAQGAITWTAARAACAARGSGWALATVPNQLAQDTIAALSDQIIWIGADDIATESIWRWSDGHMTNRTFYRGTRTIASTTCAVPPCACEPGAFCNFPVPTTQPDNWGGFEHYLMIVNTAFNPLRTWNDAAVNHASAICYACERSPCADVTTLSALTTPPPHRYPSYWPACSATVSTSMELSVSQGGQTETHTVSTSPLASSSAVATATCSPVGSASVSAPTQNASPTATLAATETRSRSPSISSATGTPPSTATLLQRSTPTPTASQHINNHSVTHPLAFASTIAATTAADGSTTATTTGSSTPTASGTTTAAASNPTTSKPATTTATPTCPDATSAAAATLVLRATPSEAATSSAISAVFAVPGQLADAYTAAAFAPSWAPAEGSSLSSNTAASAIVAYVVPRIMCRGGASPAFVLQCTLPATALPSLAAPFGGAAEATIVVRTQLSAAVSTAGTSPHCPLTLTLTIMVRPPATGSETEAPAVVRVAALAGTAAATAFAVLCEPWAVEPLVLVAALGGPCGEWHDRRPGPGAWPVAGTARYARYVVNPFAALGPVAAGPLLVALVAVATLVEGGRAMWRRRLAWHAPLAAFRVAVVAVPGAAWAAAGIVREGPGHSPLHGLALALCATFVVAVPAVGSLVVFRLAARAVFVLVPPRVRQARPWWQRLTHPSGHFRPPAAADESLMAAEPDAPTADASPAMVAVFVRGITAGPRGVLLLCAFGALLSMAVFAVTEAPPAATGTGCAVRYRVVGGLLVALAPVLTAARPHRVPLATLLTAATSACAGASLIAAGAAFASPVEDTAAPAPAWWVALALFALLAIAAAVARTMHGVWLLRRDALLWAATLRQFSGREEVDEGGVVAFSLNNLS